MKPDTYLAIVGIVWIAFNSLDDAISYLFRRVELPDGELSDERQAFSLDNPI